ncbi:class I SAM-dependent methyltransferase [Bradyrhizobium japonicum]|uniref:class I SAM-dependent methyltransferase n=1 Tax=Bradyrhizobium japonicum TaxID=375 RepID=UPI0012BB58B7|nr:class I SAM-dependent methyltransferase [Bradyrhizobium japonicum]
MSRSTKSAIARTIRANPIARKLAHLAEVALFGSEIREIFAKGLLAKYYRSMFRRQWAWQVYGEPHFSIHSGAFFGLLNGDLGQGIYAFTRAFLSAEIIREGDNVLDIGCGDGSFTKRFYAPRSALVDAIDIEESAISYATTHNGAVNISYRRLDAVNEPFPRLGYDVIIFDGAIGHFTREGSSAVLEKISSALAPQGVFCGSESIGPEGPDHLQIFQTIDDLRSLLQERFRHVRVKQQRYPVELMANDRIEAYWRCANADGVLDEFDWK